MSSECNTGCAVGLGVFAFLCVVFICFVWEMLRHQLATLDRKVNEAVRSASKKPSHRVAKTSEFDRTHVKAPPSRDYPRNTAPYKKHHGDDGVKHPQTGTTRPDASHRKHYYPDHARPTIVHTTLAAHHTAPASHQPGAGNRPSSEVATDRRLARTGGNQGLQSKWWTPKPPPATHADPYDDSGDFDDGDYNNVDGDQRIIESPTSEEFGRPVSLLESHDDGDSYEEENFGFADDAQNARQSPNHDRSTFVARPQPPVDMVQSQILQAEGAKRLSTLEARIGSTRQAMEATEQRIAEILAREEAMDAAAAALHDLPPARTARAPPPAPLPLSPSTSMTATAHELGALSRQTSYEAVDEVIRPQDEDHRNSHIKPEMFALLSRLFDKTRLSDVELRHNKVFAVRRAAQAWLNLVQRRRAERQAAAEAATAESQPVPLPAGWERHTDSEGRTYYANVQLGKSQWDVPL